MRSAIAVMVLAGTATGCVSKAQGMALGGAGVSLTGVLLLASVPDDTNQFGMRINAGVSETIGTALMIGGLASLFATAAYVELQDEPHPVQVDWQRVFRAEAAQRDQAWELSKEAFAAARANDCTTVATLAPQIKTLDEDLYSFVFLRDVAVGRCIPTDGAQDPTPVEPGDPDEPPP